MQHTTDLIERFKTYIVILKINLYKRTSLYIKIIVYQFTKTKRVIVVNILYHFVEYILSIDIGKPDSIGSELAKRITKEYNKPTYKLPTPSLNPDLPAALKGHPVLNYLDLLKKAEQKGKPIKQIKHEKPISKELNCPKCNAPYTYIYSNSLKYSPKLKKKIQKYKCKVCGKQWLDYQIKKFTDFFCPFCKKKLWFYKTREEYDIFNCRNNHCHYYKKYKTRFYYRSYFFNIHELQLASPAKPKLDFSKIHYPNNILGLAFTLNINYHLDFRTTANMLNDLFGISISHQTIYLWCESLSYLLSPLVSKLPIKTSRLFTADETYEKYAGKWGYLCATLDAHQRTLLASHFSPMRNVKAITTALLGTLNRIDDYKHKEQIELVHDCFPPYFLAVQLINQSTKFNLVSRPVKGLKDDPLELKNPYRKYKNIAERFFGILKPNYYKTRGFGSIQGAIVYNTLQAINYNYFRPHESLNNQPPIKLRNLKSNHPIEKWNKLIALAISLN